MKKLLLPIVGIAVLVIAYYAVNNWQKQTAVESDQGGEEFKVAKKEVSADEAPAGFPQGVPIEAGATIIQNYEAEVSDGRHQATRAFVSGKTVAQNYQVYLDFLTSDGWEIKNKSGTETVASLYAVKSDSELTVSITKNAVTGVVTVDLSVLAKQ